MEAFAVIRGRGEASLAVTTPLSVAVSRVAIRGPVVRCNLPPTMFPATAGTTKRSHMSTHVAAPSKAR
jgi:hypothetical protein